MMDPMLTRLFERAIAEQCDIAEYEYGRIVADPYDGNVVWPAFQNLLNAVANISKLLWGKDEQAAAGRAVLRQSFGVEDDSPFRFDKRKMRNHHEHIDERLDEWAEASQRHIFVDQNIGHVVNPRDHQPEEIFRTFEPETETLSFWGDTYDVRGVMAEVRRIGAIAHAQAKKPHWA